MAKSEKAASDIVEAAQALEQHLSRLEGLSWSIRKIRLQSDKNLARAAAGLNEVLAFPGELTQRLQTMAAAMARLQERQQAALEPLTAFAAEIQNRTKMLEAHMQTFAALGAAAGAISATLAANDGSGNAVAEAQERLHTLAESARALSKAAHDDDFPDVEREADVLKQKAVALRKRLVHTA